MKKFDCGYGQCQEEFHKLKEREEVLETALLQIKELCDRDKDTHWMPAGIWVIADQALTREYL